MANTKTIYQAYWKTGATVYVIILQKSTGYLLNDATGAFANAPADPYVALTEHAAMKGLYSLADARAVWGDDGYSWMAYEKLGASEAPATDTRIGGGYVSVRDDQIVTDGTLDDWLDAVPTLTEIEASAVLAKEATVSARPTLAQILAGVVEGTLTLKGVLRILLAEAAGKTTGGGTTSPTFRNLADTKSRISATVDTSGNRTAITLDETD